jgi:hypothetical protein
MARFVCKLADIEDSPPKKTVYADEDSVDGDDSDLSGGLNDILCKCSCSKLESFRS